MASKNLTFEQKRQAIIAYRAITNSYKTKELGNFAKFAKCILGVEVKRDKQAKKADSLIIEANIFLQKEQLKEQTVNFQLTSEMCHLLIKTPKELANLHTNRESIKKIIHNLNKYRNSQPSSYSEKREYTHTLNEARKIISSARTQNDETRLKTRLQIDLLISDLIETLDSVDADPKNVLINEFKLVALKLETLNSMNLSEDSKTKIVSMKLDLDNYINCKHNDPSHKDKKEKAFAAFNNLKSFFYEYELVDKLGLLEDVARSINENRKNKSGERAHKKISDEGTSLAARGSAKKIPFAKSTEIFKEIMGSNLTPSRKRDALNAYRTILANKNEKAGNFYKLLSNAEIAEIEEEHKLIKKSETEIQRQHVALTLGLNNLLDSQTDSRIIQELKVTSEDIKKLKQKLNEYFHKSTLSREDQINYLSTINKANIIIKLANDKKNRSTTLIMNLINTKKLENLNPDKMNFKRACSGLVDDLREISKEVFYAKDKEELTRCIETLNKYIRFTSDPWHQQAGKDDEESIDSDAAVKAIEHLKRHLHGKYNFKSVDEHKNQTIEPKIQPKLPTNIDNPEKQAVKGDAREQKPESVDIGLRASKGATTATKEPSKNIKKLKEKVDLYLSQSLIDTDISFFLNMLLTNKFLETIKDLEWDEIGKLIESSTFGAYHFSEASGSIKFQYTSEELNKISTLITNLQNHLKKNYIWK